MQLKKIELQGFKSFADKTEIIFLDGITTIVGPNGSGKSNISDALRWVLGEQSIKTLRGAKMEDVIFAGTQARKKVGFAEVSMYLDNSDATLPVEYKEVVVTRRVYRTGESNYLINNNECRLKDVQELFMDTGVGKDGYSIISQGKIDEILSSKSEERRHIFEEASGIVKYRTRKEEASKKLANTDVTLSRVTDILTEIESIIGPLEKRAETAKTYLGLRDVLKVLDVRAFIDVIAENTKSLDQLDEMIDVFVNDIETQEEHSLQVESQKKVLKERLQEISTKIEETQANYYEIQNESEKLNARIGLEESSISHSNENIKRLQEEIVEDTSKITLLTEEMSIRLEKRRTMSENKQKFEDDLVSKQEELTAILLTLDHKGVAIEQVKTEIDKRNDQKYELRVDISSMDATMEANERNIDEKKRVSQKNISLKDSLVIAKDDVTMLLNQKNKELTDVNTLIHEKTQTREEVLQQVASYRTTESALKQEILTKKSKYQYLCNLEKENEGYYKSVKEALNHSEHNNRVYGTLASLISTEERYEYAIEIALGGYLQNIVVENENEAKTLITYLKQNSLGRATFLPLTNLKELKIDVKSKASTCEGYLGVASELVTYDEKYKKAIALSLGATVIVDTIDHAISMSKVLNNSVKIVTLAGELFATSGSMTGGQSNKSKLGLIGRAEKIQKLKEEITSKETEFEVFNQKLIQVNEVIQEIDHILDELKSSKENMQIEVATLAQKYEHTAAELEKMVNATSQNQQTLSMMEEENSTLVEKIKEFEDNILQIDHEISEKQVVVEEYARFHKEKQQEIDFLNEDIVNLKISLSSFDESVASIDEMKEKIEQDVKNFTVAIKRKKEQILVFEGEIDNATLEITKIKEMLQEQIHFQKEYASISEKLKQEQQASLQREEKIEKEIVHLAKTIEHLKEEKAKIEAKKIKFDIEMENLKNSMWDQYEMTISSAKNLIGTLPKDELDAKQIAKQAEKVRQEIKALGEVSISSIEEYKTTKERYDFILNQKNDLEETKTKLNNLIANMTSIMKNQFSKQFKLITENFNETFQELFGGGKAELRLSDEGNILESGIEIEVQPPGKKLQSMMLLSGGERALTATALLFAILKIKSPPFCILDEIEAALDDVNVQRFASYIKKYSNQTQFIVITHRKGTMEVASSTYGVTMQEYGISKIVSMKLR